MIQQQVATADLQASRGWYGTQPIARLLSVIWSRSATNTASMALTTIGSILATGDMLLLA